MNDARFQDGREQPLRLVARDAGDLRVLSTLVQDAVLTGADMTYRRGARRFALLLNRFRWEEQALAGAARRPAERVRTVLEFADVRQVRQQGLDRRDGDVVLSLLSVDFSPAAAEAADGDAEADADAVGNADQPAGPGRVTLVFAGDGAIALDVDCLEVHLTDVTRPYAAPSRRAPAHRLED